MKKTMKVFLTMTALFISAVSFATTFNVANTSPTSGALSCTYSVTANIQACDRSGNCISLVPQNASIAPGANHDFTFTPPSGYTLQLSTISFTVTTSSSPSNCNFTFGTSNSTQQCNCIASNNADDVTVWTNNGSNSFSVRADIITH